jgi:hypothetical protein
MTARPFLAATWRHLVMLTWEVDPDVLAPLVPAGTSLDRWQGRAFASVVGFRFLYGPAWVPALSRPPRSALVAEGSPVIVYAPRRLAGAGAVAAAAGAV